MFNELFIWAPTKAGFLSDLLAGNILNTSIVFIEDTNELWTHGKYSLFIPPTSGKEGYILINDGLQAIWTNDFSVAVEDILSYGVEWTKNATSPILTRIGNLSLHKTLPIQSLYEGCVVNTSTKEIVYWLDPNDWNKKKDGTSSVLDGTDGLVMVHTPKFYGKSGERNNKYWVRISLYKLDDTWTEIPEMFIGAFRGTVNNLNNKAASVVNVTSDYRGGGNRSDYDTYLSTDASRSDLGKPRTALSRSTFRTWARNAGTELLSYEQYKWIFYWNYVIEYANFNCLADYNSNLTLEGFHLGGLGPGVTTWDGTWSTFNGYYPITPCGYCNDIGNNTGIKALTTGSYSGLNSHTFYVPRWRGFDNPFGDIWTNLDGIVIDANADALGRNNMNLVYTTTDPSNYGDDITKMNLVGEEIHSDGYTLEFNLGETAEIFPIVMGGDVTVGKCDYHWTGSKETTPRTLLIGGDAHDGGLAGLGYFYSTYGVGSAHSAIGFRLVLVI